MSVKKFATEVRQHVVANSITYAVSTAVALGLPYWATIKEQLSWPLAASLAIVLFAATITIIRVLSSREKYSDTAVCWRKFSLQISGGSFYFGRSSTPTSGLGAVGGEASGVAWASRTSSAI